MNSSVRSAGGRRWIDLWCHRWRRSRPRGRENGRKRRAGTTLSAMQHLEAAAAKFAEYGAKLDLDQMLAMQGVLGA